MQGGGGQARVKKVIIIDVHVITSVIIFFDQNSTLYCCKKNTCSYCNYSLYAYKVFDYQTRSTLIERLVLIPELTIKGTK